MRLFYVVQKSTGKAVDVFGSAPCGPGSPTSFLVHDGEAWAWVPAVDFKPVPQWSGEGLHRPEAKPGPELFPCS